MTSQADQQLTSRINASHGVCSEPCAAWLAAARRESGAWCLPSPSSKFGRDRRCVRLLRMTSAPKALINANRLPTGWCAVAPTFGTSELTKRSGPRFGRPRIKADPARCPSDGSESGAEEPRSEAHQITTHSWVPRTLCGWGHAWQCLRGDRFLLFASARLDLPPLRASFFLALGILLILGCWLGH